MQEMINGAASGAQTPGPHLTNGQKDVSPVALQTEAYSNGDLRKHSPKSTENQIWSFIRGNWRWGLGLLVAGGFVGVPVTTWQLNASVAKLDSKIEILDTMVTERFDAQTKQIMALQADQRMMYYMMISIDRKLDAALIPRAAQTPAAPAAAPPPHKRLPPKKQTAKKGWLS